MNTSTSVSQNRSRRPLSWFGIPTGIWVFRSFTVFMYLLSTQSHVDLSLVLLFIWEVQEHCDFRRNSILQTCLERWILPLSHHVKVGPPQEILRSWKRLATKLLTIFDNNLSILSVEKCTQCAGLNAGLNTGLHSSSCMYAFTKYLLYFPDNPGFTYVPLYVTSHNLMRSN